MATVANAEIVKGLVILTADSKSYSRALLRSMLLQLGAKSIHEVGDGAAALDAIRTISPDVMILDWDLPVLSMIDVLRMVRAPGVFPNPNLPIMVISSSGQSAYVHEAIKLGAQQFLVRPISPKMLEQRLLSIVPEFRKAALAYKLNIETPRPDS